MPRPITTTSAHEECLRALLEEIEKHGLSRSIDLVDAFVDLDGWTVPEVVDRIAALAADGRIEVRVLAEQVFWRITPRGRDWLAEGAREKAS